ncbi:hypothetical protein ACT3TB_16255 [Micrococcaceae sp. AOP34-BR2-30]
MEESQGDGRIMIGRFYTSARRFKQVLGSLPDGTKIPGGPYTYAQVGVMIAVLILGWLTRGVWGSGSAVGDLLLIIVIAVGAGFIIAKMPPSRRSPLRVLGSIIALLAHPGPGGRWKGKGLKLSLKAQRIQREQKSVVKTLARAAKKGNESHEKPALEAVSPPPELSPAGYGSSLNRLLAAHGLLDIERKN